MNDEECVREIIECSSGSEKAVGLLFERYYKKFVSHLMFRRVARQDAEDIVQDVFVKIVSSLRGSEADIKSARAYLYRALHNRFVDYLRARPPEVRASELSDDVEQDGAAIIEKVASKLNVHTDELGFLHCFQQALSSFFRKDQDAGTAIQMAVEGFTGEEMAEVLGRTHGAAREFLRQCRKKFQIVLQDLCVDYLPDRLKASSHV